MSAPPTLRTARLLVRRPVLNDAPTILQRFAGDPEVTRFLSWPLHRSIEGLARLRALERQHLVELTCGALRDSRRDRDVDRLDRPGYRDAVAGVDRLRARACGVGRGYGTEAAAAMVELASALGMARLYAICHVEHRASGRVLAKAGFEWEGVLRRHTVFPNLDPTRPADVECWARM